MPDNHILSQTGMAGKDDIADAVLGGASDFISDFFAKVIQWYTAKDDEKVFDKYVVYCLKFGVVDQTDHLSELTEPLPYDRK